MHLTRPRAILALCPLVHLSISSMSRARAGYDTTSPAMSKPNGPFNSSNGARYASTPQSVPTPRTFTPPRPDSASHTSCTYARAPQHVATVGLSPRSPIKLAPSSPSTFIDPRLYSTPRTAGESARAHEFLGIVSPTRLLSQYPPCPPHPPHPYSTPENPTQPSRAREHTVHVAPVSTSAPHTPRSQTTPPYTSSVRYGAKASIRPIASQRRPDNGAACKNTGRGQPGTPRLYPPTSQSARTSRSSILPTPTPPQSSFTHLVARHRVPQSLGQPAARYSPIKSTPAVGETVPTTSEPLPQEVLSPRPTVFAASHPSSPDTDLYTEGKRRKLGR